MSVKRAAVCLAGQLRTRTVTSTPQTLAVNLRVQGRRGVTAFGYTQAKSLIFSKYGEPKDVLKSAAAYPTNLSSYALLCKLLY
jgi:trans-2-enoyl-CoA reductase